MPEKNHAARAHPTAPGKPRTMPTDTPAAAAADVEAEDDMLRAMAILDWP